MENNVDNRLKELEARIIEQEHRPISALRNFFKRKRWANDDPRRTATSIALVWNFVFSPTAVATGGGLIALATLYFFYQQNQTMVQQLESQRAQDQLARRTLTISALYSTPPANPRIRKEALSEFVHLERAAGRQLDLSGAQLGGMSISDENLSRIVFDSAVMNSNQFSRILFTNCSFEAMQMNHAIFRDCNLANSKIIRTVATNSFLLACNLSGAEFKEANFDRVDFRKASALVKGITAEHVTFRHANFGGARLPKSKFSLCIFEAAHFRSVNFEQAEFSGKLNRSQFEYAKLSHARFHNVDMTDVILNSSDLTFSRFDDIRGLETVEFHQSNIHGAESNHPDFVSIARSRGAVDEPNLAIWRTNLWKAPRAELEAPAFAD
jgi:uncharacterized protein YjbI with pentapeptide repeats